MPNFIFLLGFFYESDFFNDWLIGEQCGFFSANWVQYDVYAKNSTFYYDKDSVKIKKLGNGTKYIEVWEKTKLASPELQTRHSLNCSQYITTNCNKYYQSNKVKKTYDCWNDKMNFLHIVEYDSAGNSVLSQQLSSTSFYSSNDWQEIIPDTVGEGKLQELCSTYRYQLK